MDSYKPAERSCDPHKTDFGPAPFTVNIPRAAQSNTNFRTALWTGCHLQMTLMSIPPCGEIGLEMHPETDQLIRVESGQALVYMGRCREELELQCRLGAGEAVFVPGGTWHNVRNNGGCALKLSSVYAPPQHPRGTVHKTKGDAEH